MMNRLLIAIFAFIGLRANANLFPQTNETRVAHEYASYDTGGKSPYMFRYMKTFADAMYPQYTNHWMPVSRSGASVYGIRYDATTATQARRSIPFWSWNTNVPVFNIECVSENGGGTSNQMWGWLTNLFAAPPIFFNFTSDTNEGVPSSTVIPLVFSGINDAPSDPNRNLDISRAATNASVFLGTVILDLWNLTWTNGLNNDPNNYFGFWSDNTGHTYAPGGLGMCLWGYIALGGETNIGSATLDWNTASVVASDNMTATGISRSGNTLSWTHYCSRMPGGWDIADGTITNDASNCFLLYPMLPNIIRWSLAFNNLNAAHSYTLSIDASNVVTLTGAQWAVGWNMLTNYNGAYWAQRKQILFDTTDWYGLDHVTLQEVGPFGPDGTPNLLAYESNAGIYPGVTGTNFINTMNTTYGWPSNMYVYDTKNHNDAQQTNHLMTLTDVTGGYVPAPYR